MTRARGALVLSAVVTVLAGVQAVLGLVLSDAYRDPDPIRTGWLGNDVVTLVLAVPALAVALVLARRGSGRAMLVWPGLLGYVAYNDGFYVFGAALNAFFPLYIALLVLSTAALVMVLVHLDVAVTGTAFSAGTPVRIVGSYLTVLGVGLAAVWLTFWAGYVFADRPVPIGPEEFRTVAALDLTVLVPALVVGGIQLWRRRPWGYVLAVAAGVQGSLYLLVLGLNSVIAVARGLSPAPGELPLWGPLAVATAGLTALLLAHAHHRDRRKDRDEADHRPVDAKADRSRGARSDR